MGKAAFLKACTKSYADKDIDVKCGDVKAGSIVLTLVGKSTKVMGEVVKKCVDKGLSFGDYEFEKGEDVTKEEEEKEEEEKKKKEKEEEEEKEEEGDKKKKSTKDEEEDE